MRSKTFVDSRCVVKIEARTDTLAHRESTNGVRGEAR